MKIILTALLLSACGAQLPSNVESSAASAAVTPTPTAAPVATVASTSKAAVVATVDTQTTDSTSDPTIDPSPTPTPDPYNPVSTNCPDVIWINGQSNAMAASEYEAYYIDRSNPDHLVWKQFAQNPAIQGGETTGQEVVDAAVTAAVENGIQQFSGPNLMVPKDDIIEAVFYGNDELGELLNCIYPSDQYQTNFLWTQQYNYPWYINNGIYPEEDPVSMKAGY